MASVIGLLEIVMMAVLLLKNLYGSEQQPEDVFDFIIVGAGSAGSVLASRLSEPENVTVLLLEAGGDENVFSEMPLICGDMQGTDIDWQYRTAPQDNACHAFNDRRCTWPRGKVLGGSSAINYMVYARGNSRDYDQWQTLGNDGWSWKDILPYFLKSEDYVASLNDSMEFHHKGGYLTVSNVPFRTPLLEGFIRAGEEIGYWSHDINGNNQSGVMPVLATLKEGRRCSAARAFLLPAKTRPNLRIIRNALVIQVLFSKYNRAFGVKYIANDSTHIARASKEVILSAGAINTPQLLMLSGVGPSQHLQGHKIDVVADLPGVGENLQDHVCTTMIWTAKNPIPFRLGQLILQVIPNLLQWSNDGTGPISSLGGLEGLAFVSTPFASNRSGDWPDIQFHYASTSWVSDGGHLARDIEGITNEVWEQAFQPINNEDSFSILPTLLRPKSRGVVRLVSAEPSTPPLIDPRYLSHPDDIKVLLEGVKIALRFGNTSALRHFDAELNRHQIKECSNHSLDSDDHWLCYLRYVTKTMYHPVGTCKMGVSQDKMSVVRHDLRVYNVTGLRVVDASVMPTIVSGNTNAPVIAIAEKAADLIKRRWNLTDETSTRNSTLH